jgi:hypothetical protein
LAISGTNSMYQLLTTTIIFFLTIDIIWWVSSFLHYLFIYCGLRSNKKKSFRGQRNSFIQVSSHPFFSVLITGLTCRFCALCRIKLINLVN